MDVLVRLKDYDFVVGGEGYWTGMGGKGVVNYQDVRV